jgi:crotonobetainyl-CoA:carnitine CoA-transferase CaiB-like acyl-CoA transferase
MTAEAPKKKKSAKQSSARKKPRVAAKSKAAAKAVAKPRSAKPRAIARAKTLASQKTLAKAVRSGSPIGRRPSARKAPARKSTKRAPLPGPKIKRAAKKATKKTTTREKLVSAERRPIVHGRRPLDGIRVLDLSRLLPGPYASHILANFGAEVIKIEKPGEGDYMRAYLPKAQGVNAAFLTINRGKKSLAIDLKHEAGKEAFVALVKKSDVVLDGFRPGVMGRLGLGYEQLSKINPKLIYAALTGYGQTGPYAQLAGHDLNYVAFAGMLDLLGESDGMPAVPGIQIADVAAGALPTVIGVLLALQHRSKANEGQMVDISMFDAVLGLMPVQVANYTATKRRPKRGHERLFGRYACYNIYPVRNSRYLAVAALEPKFWRALCEAIEREDLIEDQYVEGDAQQILKAELTRTFQKKEVSDWMEIFEEADVCVTEVREISRAVQDDSVAERRMVTPIRGPDGGVYEQLGVFPQLSETPGYVSGEAPARGSDNREILESLNYSVERINELLEANVIEGPPTE